MQRQRYAMTFKTMLYSLIIKLWQKKNDIFLSKLRFLSNFSVIREIESNLCAQLSLNLLN